MPSFCRIRGDIAGSTYNRAFFLLNIPLGSPSHSHKNFSFPFAHFVIRFIFFLSLKKMRLSLGILAFGLCAAQAAASKVGNKTPQIASPQDVRNTLDRVTSYAQLFAQVSTKSVNGSRTKGHTSEPAKRSEQGKGGSCVINSQKNSTGSRKTGKERRELSKRTGNTGFANTAINWECPGQLTSDGQLALLLIESRLYIRGKPVRTRVRRCNPGSHSRCPFHVSTKYQIRSSL